MKSRFNWWPAAVTVLFAITAVSGLFPKSETGFRAREFGRLPVLVSGRVQPFDSVARNALLQLRGKQTAPIRLHFSVFDPKLRGESMPAIHWLLEVMFRPEVADTRKVFRVDHPELISMLRLPGPDEAAGEDGKHFSFDQLKVNLQEIENQARRANAKEGAHRTPLDQQLLKLYNGVLLYHRLKNSIGSEETHDLAADVEAFRLSIPAGMAAIKARESGKEVNQEDLNRFLAFLKRYDFVSQSAYPLIVPPLDRAKAAEDWDNMGEALMKSAREGQLHPVVIQYAAMAAAFHQQRPEDFNKALTEYQQWLQHGGFTPEISKARAETVFNQAQPFYRALVIYLAAFLFVCAYWVRMSENIRRAGLQLVWLALVIHTCGLLYRMLLEGRPPVTNLYSSAIFIGWAAAILGVILERIYRVGLGTASASFIGFVTLIIAHNLALGGDTMEMMRAVLDSNFWLATHVVAITIGYSATFLAGFLGILLILLGVFTRVLTDDLSKVIARLIYGIVCFATLFSFVGTILGGIWADQSWGRFWGWDPKENGALIIVLWNALILHAKWAGMVRERGLAGLAVFGNVVTSYSWFGVNMLGVGLHSYGFMESGFKWLILFVVSQVAIIGLACLPTDRWLSFRKPLTPARA